MTNHLVQKEFAPDRQYPKITFDVPREVVDDIESNAHIDGLVDAWNTVVPLAYNCHLAVEDPAAHFSNSTLDLNERQVIFNRACYAVSESLRSQRSF